MKPKPTVVTKGLSFRTGFDLNRSGLPILLELSYGQSHFPTYWTPNDAELLAYSILKHVELCRREMAKQLAGATPAPSKPDLPRM